MSNYYIDGPFVYSLTTDASLEGWGAVIESLPVNGDQQSSGGRWTIEEKLDHINVLELKAGLLGLQSFCANVYSCHVKMSMDNTTSICYVNSLSGSRSNGAETQLDGLSIVRCSLNDFFALKTISTFCKM